MPPVPQPDLALQGNLFGDAEPASSPPNKDQKKEGALDDLELTQDAKQRPRQRQLQRQKPQQHPEPTSNDNNNNHDANSDEIIESEDGELIVPFGNEKWQESLR